MSDADPTPWLPPDFEPLEVMADGRRLTRADCGANDGGRIGLYDRIREAIGRSRSNDVSIVEVGSWAGANALRLSWELRQLYVPATVYCVDTWKGSPPEHGDSTTLIAQAIGPGNVFATFLRNCRSLLFERIVPLEGESLFWAKHLPIQADVIFLDADHSYEAVKAELPFWWRKLKSVGLLCGHDYTMFPGVKRAVDEWVKEQALDLEVDGDCWFVRCG